MSSKSEIYRRIFVSLFFPIANIFVSLGRAKLFAVLLEPEAFGRLNLLQQITQVTVQLASLGAEATSSREACLRPNHKLGVFYRSSLLFFMVTSIIIVAILTIVAFVFKDFFNVNFGSWKLSTIGISLAAVASCYYFVNHAILAQQKKIGLIQLNTLTGNIFFVFVLALLYLGSFSNTPLFVFLIIQPATIFIISVITLKKIAKINKLYLTAHFTFDRQVYSDLWAMGTTVVLSSLINPIAQLTYRTVMNNQLSSEMLGYFAAITALAIASCSPIMSYLFSYYYRDLLETKQGQAKHLIFKNFIFVCSACFVIFLIIILIGQPVISLLLSERYASNFGFFCIWIVGEMIRTANQCFSMVALVRLDHKYLIFSEILWALLITTGFIWLSISGFSLISFGYLYILLNIVFTMCTISYHRYRGEF